MKQKLWEWDPATWLQVILMQDEVCEPLAPGKTWSIFYIFATSSYLLFSQLSLYCFEMDIFIFVYLFAEIMLAYVVLSLVSLKKKKAL